MEIINKKMKLKASNKIRPIFWSQIDDCVVDYPLRNKPLQRISSVYPVYFVHSGTKCVEILKPVYHNANFIACSNNNDNEKANVMFSLLKAKNDYDVLIRTCCDCIITDVSKLLDILVEKLLGKHAAIGNVMYKNNQIKWIRGGCNAITKSIIDSIDILQIDVPFDIAFTRCVQKTGAEIIPYSLFREGASDFLKFPACHPIKTNRYKSFSKIIYLLEVIKK